MLIKQIAIAIKEYFETLEYKINVLQQQNNLTLQTIIEDKPGKTYTEYLDAFIQELRTLSHGLTPDLRSDSFTYTKLITVCQTVPALQIACQKPSSTLTGLITDLQASVAVYDCNHPKLQLQPEALFTDRRYHGQDNRQGKFRREGHSPNDRSWHNERPYSQCNYGQPNNNNRSQGIIGKCYVCNKEGCRPYKYTQEEQAKSYKQFPSKYR